MVTVTRQGLMGFCCLSLQPLDWLITAAFGLTGLVLNMLGIIKTPPERGLVSGLVIIVAVAAVLSLYFYLQYYKVKPMAGYFFGMVPLITEAISMGVFEFLTR